ncbi:hypothetical protein MBAV_004645 [Candidatus Magnetobacterium bavaricum]|uniref:Uncharacterized protein n=1 Tax=Candidatus Magnetobacterium bavaricum TaxID=29290 RepID=A0A0F3GMN7_9BACT|nr:hypothetical protein MBAV_004645 [Candidatus Magnetobacterium bavaricum]
MRFVASVLASSSSSVYPFNSPPVIFLKLAIMSLPICFARTVLPVTMPKCSTICLPGTLSMFVRIIARSPFVVYLFQKLS